MNKLKYFILLVGCCTLIGCADSVSFEQALKMELVGFWYGLWHGIVAPFAWIISLLSDSTAIYAIYNNGGWYDFGFMLGIGGLSSSATINNRK